MSLWAHFTESVHYAIQVALRLQTKSYHALDKCVLFDVSDFQFVFNDTLDELRFIDKGLIIFE